MAAPVPVAVHAAVPVWEAGGVSLDPAAPSGSTRRSIIDAAVPLIAERGFSATSVDEIAEAAGVAKGSVYYNFGSKADLFAAILTDGVTRLTAALRAATRREPDAGVAALVGELLTHVAANPAFAKVIAAEVFRTGRDWQGAIGLIRDEAMSVFGDAVQGADPTIDRPDAQVIGAAVFGATLVAGLDWLAFQPDREEAEVRSAILRLVGPLGG